MRVTATTRHVDGRVVLECCEYEATGEGKDLEEALSALRAGLRDRADRPQAVAPPSQPEEREIEIQLIPVAADSSDHGPQGPGEASPPRALGAS